MREPEQDTKDHGRTRRITCSAQQHPVEKRSGRLPRRPHHAKTGEENRCVRDAPYRFYCAELRSVTITDRRSPAKTASKGYPTVDTADGRWWIERTDPDNSLMEEFLLAPRIYDAALDPGVSDLDFDFEGNVYLEPPEGRPFDTTGSLNSFLAPICTPGIRGCPPDPPCDPPPPPKKVENDEPVEIPDIPEDPYAS